MWWPVSTSIPCLGGAAWCHLTVPSLSSHSLTPRTSHTLTLLSLSHLMHFSHPRSPVTLSPHAPLTPSLPLTQDVEAAPARCVLWGPDLNHESWRLQKWEEWEAAQAMGEFEFEFEQSEGESEGQDGGAAEEDTEDSDVVAR